MGCIVYLLLASGEEQRWALGTGDNRVEDINVAADVMKNNEHDNLAFDNNEKSNGHGTTSNNQSLVTATPTDKSTQSSSF